MLDQPKLGFIVETVMCVFVRMLKSRHPLLKIKNFDKKKKLKKKGKIILIKKGA